jgi:hypothetical protein
MHFFSLFFFLSLAYASVQIVTITATAPPAPTSSQYTSDATFESAALQSHNLYRHLHNASTLVWNSSLATGSAAWSTACHWGHSQNRWYGENLAAGFSNVTDAVKAWALESALYSYSHPGFSEETGHFTQVVWRNTTSVGCGRAKCKAAGIVPGWYLTCRYWPAGNVEGEYVDNVRPSVNAVAKLRPSVMALVGGIFIACMI